MGNPRIITTQGTTQATQSTTQADIQAVLGDEDKKIKDIDEYLCSVAGEK